jgi:hypothetical protein
MDKPPSYSMFFDLRGRRDSEVKNRQIAGLRLTPEEGVAVLTRDREAYLKDMRQFCSKFMGPSGDRLFACGAGHGTCVDAYGRAQMCMMLRHPDMAYDLARCARCFLKGLCEQCPAKSWAEHGTLDTPVEYLCRVAHAQARDLGLLQDGERSWEVTDWHSRVDRLR